MNLSNNTSESRLVPHTYAIQQHLDKFESWTTTHVGSPSDRLHFETTEISHQDFFLPFFVDNFENAKKSPLVTKVEIPLGTIPRIKLGAIVHPSPTDTKVEWEGTWRDTPVAVWFKDCKFPMLYFHVDFVVGNSTYEMTKSLIVVNKTEVEKVLKALSSSFKQVGNMISVIRGEPIKLPDNGYNWDKIVLHAETNKMVREDFESFLEAKDWFQANDLPWRRGYLFYGPPGNGKTTALRVMASHPLVSGFTLDIGGKDVDNSDLTELFARATRRTPALIILEDIDRMFAKQAQEEERRKITLQHLLNCMDGVGISEGVIMVATANEPSDLDPALLKRPGRFDRIVEFQSPGPKERLEYFRTRKALSFNQDELDHIVELTGGFSFAQLRESFILAGTNAFTIKTASDRAISVERLEAGIKQIKRSLKNISSYSLKKGAGYTKSPAGFASVVNTDEEEVA